ncbi:unnamed protein product [Didymodactylos carnosus]|uniref:PAP-associated domain-containing protein n=1 Tax=Didymodactylos carnosus TaxID=1234261 RepID=A0A8S2EWW5_9BILA|nr:unnamed protein product [Didymodactylos carnosus]CAF4097569.1 unnamed protein product [Didymodactylos carnosus]
MNSLWLNAKSIVHTSTLKPNVVSKNLIKGTWALRWPQENTKPLDTIKCEQMNIDVDVPVQDKLLTIYYGHTFVPDKELCAIHFCFDSPSLVKEWTDELFQYARNPFLRNLSGLQLLEKIHSKIVNGLVEEVRQDRKEIAVRTNSRETETEQRILKALDYVQLPHGRALKNSYLLRTYTLIDQRTKSLGILLKLLAHIGLDNQPKQQWTEDGKHNIYFFDKLERLDEVWTKHGRNNSSVQELWAQFLHYYTNVFKFNKEVVSVRQTSSILKKQDQLNQMLVIEDPFILEKNCASNLSSSNWSKIRLMFSCALRIIDNFRLPENLLKIDLKAQSSSILAVC